MTGVRGLAVAIAMLSLTACGPNRLIEDRYYSLVLAAHGEGAAGKDEDTAAWLIVGPVVLPRYLSERGLAMQVGPNRIESASHHFWAEPLDAAIAKVLVRDIAERTTGIGVERESGRFTPRQTCRVRLEFDAFHPTDESRVVASGRFWISAGETNSRQTFRLTRTLSIDGYAHAVDLLRDSLRALAGQISDKVEATPACRQTALPADRDRPVAQENAIR